MCTNKPSEEDWDLDFIKVDDVLRCIGCGKLLEECDCNDRVSGLTYLKYGYTEGADSLKPTARQIGGTHYRDCAIQPGTYIYKNGLNWYEGNAVKYITRHRVKGGKEDVLKAIHYLEMLLEEEYGN